MPTMFLTGAAAASGIAWINSLGNLGGFFGPSIVGWAKNDQRQLCRRPLCAGRLRPRLRDHLAVLAAHPEGGRGERGAGGRSGRVAPAPPDQSDFRYSVPSPLAGRVTVGQRRDLAPLV